MTSTEAAPKVQSHPERKALIPVPGLGTVELTGPELVYVGGIAALGLFGFIDWPIALVIGAGHLLAADRGSRDAQALGEAIEDAG